MYQPQTYTVALAFMFVTMLVGDRGTTLSNYARVIAFSDERQEQLVRHWCVPQNHEGMR